VLERYREDVDAALGAIRGQAIERIARYGGRRAVHERNSGVGDVVFLLVQPRKSYGGRFADAE